MAKKNQKSLCVRHFNNTQRIPEVDISMQILSSFMAVIGTAAIAFAFIALNASKYEKPDLAIAAIGIGVTVLSVSFFKTLSSKEGRIHDPKIAPHHLDSRGKSFDNV